MQEEKTIQSEEQEIPSLEPTRPIIHTYQSDAYAAIKEKSLDALHISANEMDSQKNIVKDITQSTADSKRREILIFVISFFIIVILGVFLYIKNRPQPLIVTPGDVKYFTVHDTWPQIGDMLDAYTNIKTDSSTSTDNYLIINITDFTGLYSYMLHNEYIFNDIANDKFKLGKLSEFKDVTIENHDLRIADGESGAMVYGYVGTAKLIIANSIINWIAASKK